MGGGAVSFGLRARGARDQTGDRGAVAVAPATAGRKDESAASLAPSETSAPTNTQASGRAGSVLSRLSPLGLPSAEAALRGWFPRRRRSGSASTPWTLVTLGHRRWQLR